MNLDLLKRLSQDLDSLTTLLEGVAHRADDLLTDEMATAHGQRPLPGLGDYGEEIAGMVGLEARIRELTAENERLVKRVADLEIEKDRQAQYSEDADAACETAEERAQSLRTALFQVRDSGRLAGAKAIASRALDEDAKARDVAAEKARQAGSGQAAD